MRRAAEQRHVTGLSRIGIHNVSSTAREDYEKARAMASTIPSRGLWRRAIACLIAVRRASHVLALPAETSRWLMEYARRECPIPTLRVWVLDRVMPLTRRPMSVRVTKASRQRA